MSPIQNEPILTSQALGLVVSSGVAMVALLCHCLTAEQATAIVVFGNAVVAVIVGLFGRSRVTPVASVPTPKP